MTHEEQYSFSDFGEDKADGNKDKGLVTVQSGLLPFDWTTLTVMRQRSKPLS